MKYVLECIFKSKLSLSTQKILGILYTKFHNIFVKNHFGLLTTFVRHRLQLSQKLFFRSDMFRELVHNRILNSGDSGRTDKIIKYTQCEPSLRTHNPAQRAQVESLTRFVCVSRSGPICYYRSSSKYGYLPIY